MVGGNLHASRSKDLFVLTDKAPGVSLVGYASGPGFDRGMEAGGCAGESLVSCGEDIDPRALQQSGPGDPSGESLI